MAYFDTLLEMGVGRGRSAVESWPVPSSFVGRGCALGFYALAPDCWRYPCVSRKLAKVCVAERRKLRHSHRRPAGTEGAEHGFDVLTLRLLHRRPSASQAPGCRVDSFLVLIHSAKHIASRLRCHRMCDSVSDMRNTEAKVSPVKCGRCHRVLRSARSCREGYGPGCRAIMRAAAIAAAVKGFTEVQIERARELIELRALVATSRPGVFLVAGSDGAVYKSHSQTCNCPSGLRRLTACTCKHSLAVRIRLAA